MPVTLVGFSIGEAGNFFGPQTATSSVAVSAGSCLLCPINGCLGFTTSAIATVATVSITSTGVTWTAGPSVSVPTAYFDSGSGFWWTETLRLFYIANASAATLTASCTITAPGTTVYSSLGFRFGQFAGLSASPLDATVAATGSGGTPSAGALTASGTDLIFAAEIDWDSSSYFGNIPTHGTGYTTSQITGGFASMGLQYILNASAGTYTASFGSARAYPWGVVAIGFKAASAPGSSPSFQTQPQLIGF
jgi:hypothetical protein